MGTTSTSTSTSTAIGGAQPPTPNELEEVALPSIPVDSVDPNPSVSEASVPVFMDDEDTPGLESYEYEDPEDRPSEDEPVTPKKKRNKKG